MADEPGQTGPDAGAGSWSGALLGAGCMIALSYLAFVLIPNTLLGYLTTRMTPVGRDLVVTGVWALAFLFVCVLFVRLQWKGRA